MENVARATPKNISVRSIFVNPSTATTTQIVAAVAGKSYVVVSVAVVSTIANNITFNSAAGAISATWPLGANGGIVLDYNEHGWFRTNSGEALQVVTSAASATGVHVCYVELTN